jgi:hypothetical protein
VACPDYPRRGTKITLGGRGPAHDCHDNVGVLGKVQGIDYGADGRSIDNDHIERLSDIGQQGRKHLTRKHAMIRSLGLMEACHDPGAAGLVDLEHRGEIDIGSGQIIGEGLGELQTRHLVNARPPHIGIHQHRRTARERVDRM